MFRAIIHPSSGACDFFVVSPHWLCVLVSMCVGVSVWLGWSGIRVAGLPHGYPHIPHEQTNSASARIRIPHNRSQTTTQHQHTSNQVCVSSYTRHQNIFRKHYQKTNYTQRKINKHKTLQQSIFAETRFLQQPHTARLNTRH